MASIPAEPGERLAERLGRGDPIEQPLPDGGMLRIERPLPYLLVYRATGAEPDVSARLIRSEASYLLWRGRPDDPGLGALVRDVVSAGSTRHGAFLVLEVWAVRGADATLRIFCPAREGRAAVDALGRGLHELARLHPDLTVEVVPAEERHPSGAAPLLTISESYALGCLLLGIEVPALYLQQDGRIYPLFFRRFREIFSAALRQAIFDFLRVETDAHIENYRALGPRTVDEAVWAADRALEEIGVAFDFLLLISPINEDEAWLEFEAGGQARAPNFRYRLLPFDPDVLKRRLYAVELEHIEDPALLYLLGDKRDELDKEISMLAERGSPAFLYSSIRMFRRVDPALLELAETILARLPPEPAVPPQQCVDAEGFRAAALREIARYQARAAAFTPEVQVRPDVSGLLVSRGNLLIGQELLVDPKRKDALLQHEVGTHVLTYANGAAQPLRQLARGLADYDELQEALGVLAEYLAGGLTRDRLRTLAARVIAAHAAERGADFVEVFRRLTRDHGFEPYAAFDVTARVYHGGGFTRDLIYLRGLELLLEYLGNGGTLEPLYMGKLGLKHVPLLQELRDRSILRDPLLLPVYLERPDAQARLEAVRGGKRIPDLLEELA